MNKQEILVVKNLGDQIGYGHLMALASALWRYDLNNKGYPQSGAFIPAIAMLMTKEGRQLAQSTIEIYDEEVKSSLSDAT